MRFGTSGLRGLVTDMTDPVCEDHAEAFVRSLRQASGPVLVGRDLRPSSPRIVAACSRGILRAGGSVLDCGVVPTPALALAAMRRGAPAIMVTGSHIPFDRNGLKFYRSHGEIGKADEADILAALAALPRADGGIAPRPAGGAAAVGRLDGVGAAYVARAVDFFGGGQPALAGLRVGVWLHSAAGRDLLVEALAVLGAAVVPLGRGDGFVPIDTEAVAANDRKRIAAWVSEHRLDALVSTDGDGDRPLIADETGAVLRGDAVGLLTARLLGADGIATPVSSSTALERAGWPVRIERTRIGSPHVLAGLAGLAARGAVLPVGYEANGGFLLGAAVARGGRRLDALPTRDALVPILALLTGAAGRPLSGLLAELPQRATASDRIAEVPDEVSRRFLARLEREAAAQASLLGGLGEVIGLDTLDGVRLILGSGELVHLRQSGNAPELRVYTEAEDEARSLALLASMVERARAALGA